MNGSTGSRSRPLTGSGQTFTGRAVDPREAVEAICYPRPGTPDCVERLRDLEEAGVEAVVDKGPLRLGGLHVLGKGWASVVVLVVWRGRPAAAKILRTDSRRRSLLWEAAALSVASWLGVSPRVYAFTPKLIVMEYVEGSELGGFTPRSCWEAWHVLRRLAVKAWLLDRMGLLHNELARPHGQVLVRSSDLEPFIIDFESSTPRPRGSRRTNLSQLIGGLKTLEWAVKAMPGLASQELRRVLRAYKESPGTAKLLNEVLNALGEPAPGCSV